MEGGCSANITKGHTFAVLNYKQIDTFQMIKVYNPFNRNYYVGTIDQEFLEENNLTDEITIDKKSGVFYLSMEEYAACFNSTFIGLIYPDFTIIKTKEMDLTQE